MIDRETWKREHGEHGTVTEAGESLVCTCGGRLIVIDTKGFKESVCLVGLIEETPRKRISARWFYGLEDARLDYLGAQLGMPRQPESDQDYRDRLESQVELVNFDEEPTKHDHVMDAAAYAKPKA